MSALWDRIRKNPTFYSKALDPEEFGAAFKWHKHADSTRSSQIFCVSAFKTLSKLASNNRVISALLSEAFPQIATRGRPRAWTIGLEHEDRELLGEGGPNQPSSIDVLCLSSKEVVCIESKFLVDAREGFGQCSQKSRGHCGGFHGPGSDRKTGTSAWCRLENWEGPRTPRLYWTLGKAYFRNDVFAPQKSADDCPLSGPNYQLMRNFLFAAALAERERKRFFGVLVLCPTATSGLIAEQVESFRAEILQPAYRDRVQFLSYETYVRQLRDAKDSGATDLADFLEERIESLCS